MPAPRFCGSPGWPSCPPISAVLPDEDEDKQLQAWQNYLKGRSEAEVPLGEIPDFVQKYIVDGQVVLPK